MQLPPTTAGPKPGDGAAASASSNSRVTAAPVPDPWMPAVFSGVRSRTKGSSKKKNPSADTWSLPPAGGTPAEWTHAGNLMAVLCRGASEMARLQGAEQGARRAREEVEQGCVAVEVAM